MVQVNICQLKEKEPVGGPDLLIEQRGLCAAFSQELTQGFKHSCVIPDTLLVEGHTFTILPT